MGKAKTHKRLRKLAGFKPGDEVKYEVTKAHEIIFQNEDGEETGRVEAATLVTAGPRKTYQLMKTFKV